MTKKTAILHVPNYLGEASIAEMLTSAGYQTYGVGRDLARVLNKYKPYASSHLLPQAGLSEFSSCDLLVIVKHYLIPNFLEDFPRLKDRILWFDINGGEPGVFIPEYPVKTCPLVVPVPYVSSNKRYADGVVPGVSGPRYICYIPLVESQKPRFLQAAHHREMTGAPVCLINNPYHWGYGWVVDRLIERGVQFYGGFGAPAGELPLSAVPDLLHRAICYIHPKSRDCPGCSLYQALLAGCPVVLPSLFLETTLYTDLYVDGETCLIAQDDDKLGIEERSKKLAESFEECIARLRNPKTHDRIGSTGRHRADKLMWSPKSESDVESFRQFMESNFGA